MGVALRSIFAAKLVKSVKVTPVKNRFKGRMCVYCQEAEATTADHVISREFFLVEQRGDLPQAPACHRCNNEKSKLEHYLTAVLPFGGRHPDASVNLSTMVPKRLEKNAKLHRELAVGLAASGGVSVPLHPERIEKLFAMIAQGLAWYHWGVTLGKDHAATSSVFHDSGKQFFDQMFSCWNTPKRVSENLGSGTFAYQGAQATDDPQSTVWRFSMYGGVLFGGDPRLPGSSSLAVAVTGSSSFVRRLQFRGAVGRRDSMKIGRNEPCPCGSGKKYKKCCVEAQPAEPAPARSNTLGSCYQPIAAHGYGPSQFDEMMRFGQQMRPAR